MNKVQTIILGVFGVFTVIAVMIFSGFINIPDKGDVAGAEGRVIVWGVLDQGVMGSVFKDFKTDYEDLDVIYIQKDKDSFNQELLEALASGTGPDLFLLSQDLILKYQDRVFPVPYTTFPERTFTDNFVQASNLFLSTEGLVAFPIVIDPLVMYYNRNLLENEGIVVPPTKWDEFFKIAPQLTKFNDNLSIRKSGVALGEVLNIDHAKEIISMLFLQLDNSIVVRQGEEYIPVLQDPFNPSKRTGEQVLTFFTEFSNPLNDIYSWNKSLPRSKDMFLAGDLAIYFGFASELLDIQRKNPNLNFDIAAVPQKVNTETIITFGNVYGLAISKQSQNSTGAFIVASTIANDSRYAQIISERFFLPPVKREILLQGSQDYYMGLMYNEALHSRAWLDPDDKKTDEIFADMVEDVISGKENEQSSTVNASQELLLLLKSL
jgi:ABC-type glycerol-3-phosphate transport system substrate-binding protein